MTEKEKLCVLEWINNGFNGTQAYMTVFKNCKKSSTAKVSFCKMMKKDDVRAFKDEMINNISSFILQISSIKYMPQLFAL